MSLKNAEDSLAEIERSLQQTLDRRERLLKVSRDVILSCSRAIVLLHAGKKAEASEETRKAKALLDEMKKDAKGSLARYLVSPETEFVEATVVEAIVSGKRVPTIADLSVSDEAYLLGLLDTVGELKRMLLVSITQGKTRKASEYFAMIEKLYAVLSPFAVFDNVVNGVRRKIDVARMITEDTRGIVAEETRREVLMDSLDRLQGKKPVRARR